MKYSSTKVLKRSSRIVLLSSAVGIATLALPSQAQAACTINGTGTITNIGTNSTLNCTGVNGGINAGSANTNADVQVENGGELNGVSNSSISLNGDDSQIIIGNSAETQSFTGNNVFGSGIVRNTSLSVTGANSGIFVAAGSQLMLTSPGQGVSVSSTGGRFHVGSGALVVTQSSILLQGGSNLDLLGGSIEASSNWTGGPLILGGASDDFYNLNGRLSVSAPGGLGLILAAGDGADEIRLDSMTEFTDIVGPSTGARFLLDGGAGYDQMYLSGTNNSQTSFDSIGIEALVVAPQFSNDSWTIGGTHEFDTVDIQNGILTALGDAALGNIGSNVTIANPATLIFDASTGGAQFQHIISGGGRFELVNGSSVFSYSSAGFNGVFEVTGYSAVVAAYDAIGLGNVINNGTLILESGRINGNISGTGDVIVRSTGTSVLSGNNSFAGDVDIQSGTLRITNLSALSAGQVSIGTGSTLDIAAITGVLTNNLTGDGALRFSGTGQITINQANAGFSGAVTIASGRIFLNDGLGLGTGNISLSGALNPGDIYLANNLSGSTSIEKNSTGLTTLAGNNSGYSGGILGNAGTIRVLNANGLGTATVQLSSAGTLQADIGSGSTTIGNTIQGSGIFRKSGVGILTMTGANTYSGGTIIDAGTLRVNGTASLGTGAISVASGATLLFDNTANATFGNGMSGSGLFSKQGSGQLTFTNPFSIGTLAIDAGRVRVNNTVTTNATVASGATLDGTGRIIGNLTNNGTVAPGNSIGTLTVQGNYVHTANSSLDIEFDGSGGIDLLTVTGTATLNGGTLRFVSLGGAEGSGGTFLTAAGGVTGTFANVQTVGAQLPLAVIYQTNSAIMAPSVLTARPSTFNAQFLAAADTGFGFIDSVASVANRPIEGKSLWLQSFGVTGKRSASGATLGYDHGSYGISGGLTVPVSDDAVIGVAVGWANGDIDLASNGGGGSQDSVLASFYARYSEKGISLLGGAFYGKVDQNMLRNVSFNGFSASVDGNTKSDLYGAYIGLAVPLGSTGGWKFNGNVRASIVHQSQKAYAEGGSSPLRLSIAKQGVDTVEGQVGLSASKRIGVLDLRFDLGGRYLAAQGGRTIPVTFAASNAAVLLQGDTRDNLHGFASAGLEYAVSETVKLHLGYVGQIGTTDRHEARVGISMAF